MVRLVALIALVLVSGCKERNSLFCQNDMNANDPACAGQVDAQQACETSTDCTGNETVCRLPDRVCVECTTAEADACTGTSPVCDDGTNRCVGCTEHSDCMASSNVCLPTGACAETAAVAYVSATGTDPACTKLAPCGTLDDALKTNLTTIKFEAGLVSDTKLTVIDSRALTILAERGAKLDRDDSGTILEVKGTSNVQIYDLEITGAAGINDGIGISMPVGTARLALHRVKITACQSLGLSVAANQGLSMDRSIISGNAGGGVSISNVDFVLTNNIIVFNGGATSTTGGLTLSPATATHTFEFNTISDNSSTGATASVRGVNCVIPMNGANNIVNINKASASCTLEYTLFETGAAVTGTNKAGEPAFLNTNPGNPLAPNYFRIGATSAALDSANPASMMAVDIDADVRPAGAADIGADELQ